MYFVGIFLEKLQEKKSQWIVEKFSKKSGKNLENFFEKNCENFFHIFLQFFLRPSILSVIGSNFRLGPKMIRTPWHLPHFWEILYQMWTQDLKCSYSHGICLIFGRFCIKFRSKMLNDPTPSVFASFLGDFASNVDTIS